ncbi:MAG TPA: oxygenase MpaB family protein [Pseudonocardia sp.]|uniref:oxygenase MpaB family protein n=1 Tax=Pseudonocardia sp. TaxID=60912 RepID=UPI002BC1C235|nr:oxygenase MpaB family protein [Pseudonocardia sp.]HTF55306.1 oxygenase MpaB family protein [Pseudonocardia sp.]
MTAEITDRVDADRAPAGEPALFTPDTLFWELSGQYLYAATTGSAFVLQVMHPAIGAVVDRWSTYRTDPWGRASRSFASVQTWIYGGQTALDEGRRLRRMHKDLGAVDELGRSHHALSAEPWAWVPLTAFHATVTCFRYFMPRPLSAEQEEQAYQETLRMCRILRVPERMLPPTTAAYWAYFDDMIENTLENHPTAHQVLATAASAPPLPGLPGPLRRLWAPVRGVGSRLNYLVTVGTLPPAARDKLGLSWSRAEELELRALGKLAGRLNAPLPERIKYMPIAYHARRAARAQQQLTDALTDRPM